MSVRTPYLWEMNDRGFRQGGVKPTGGEQALRGKAKDRDYIKGIASDTFDKGGFIESIATEDVGPDELDALTQQYIPQGVSGEPVPFEENVRWLEGIAERDEGKAGSAARKILGTIKYYLGDDL